MRLARAVFFHRWVQVEKEVGAFGGLWPAIGSFRPLLGPWRASTSLQTGSEQEPCFSVMFYEDMRWMLEGSSDALRNSADHHPWDVGQADSPSLDHIPLVCVCVAGRGGVGVGRLLGLRRWAWKMSNRIFEEIKILCRGRSWHFALRWADTRDREWQSEKYYRCAWTPGINALWMNWQVRRVPWTHWVAFRCILSQFQEAL